MISVTVNGKQKTLDADLSIHQLLEELNVNPRLVAVAVNGEVIPRKERVATVVHEGDVVEIVRAVGGGAGP